MARVHREVAQARETFNHTLTKHLVTNHDLVVIEDLQVRNMSQRNKAKPDETREGHGEAAGQYAPGFFAGAGGPYAVLFHVSALLLVWCV